jgi:hypothetical protein
MTFYDRDPSVPFWRSNTNVDSLFAAHAHSHERAQAWLRFRDATDTITNEAAMVRGHFELGLLAYHTYTWSFTPTHKGEPAIVLPVYENFRMVDLLAISRHDPHNIWGCTIGDGQFIGSTATNRKDRTSPLRVYKTPINWLLGNCDGILPLSKSFFPSLQHAPSIIAAEGLEHAWEISEYAFMAPAERLGLDCDAAERDALNKIGFEVAA